jgi:hypothetical protein
MESLHGFQPVRMDHELIEIPLNRPPGTFSPTGGEGWDEGAAFMGSFHGLQAVRADHEPTPGPSEEGSFV